MQFQPPPNIETPTWLRRTLRSHDRWIVSALLFVALVFVVSVILEQRMKAMQTYAVSNSRQLGMCLFEFESEYGKFPDASTIAAVKDKSGSLLPLGTKTSNDYFRQLIAAGIAQGEQFFSADIVGARKPDGMMGPCHAIGVGECGFSYLSGLSSKGNPSRPLVVTPLIFGTSRFDPKPFDGKAVILKMDNSVIMLPIDKEGRVFMAGRKLLDPLNPIWEGKPPIIVWPDL